MNPASLGETLPGKNATRRVMLVGFQRKFNAYVEEADCLALNIVPEKNSEVEGVLISVTKKALAMLQARECGYACVDVTGRIKDPVDGRVFTFIAPNREYPGKKIWKSYLQTCLNGVPQEKQSEWLQDTIIQNEVEDDTAAPRYRNVGD